MEDSSPQKLAVLRKKLDRLGYRQSITIECLPLVERMLNDLLKTAEGLQNIKRQYEEIKTGSSQVSGSVEPLKREIERLQRENNDLHIEIIRTKEELDQKDIKWSTVQSRMDEQKNHLKFLMDKKEAELTRVCVEKESYIRQIAELKAKLFLPSEGIALDNVPREFENEVLRRETNSRRND